LKKDKRTILGFGEESIKKSVIIPFLYTMEQGAKKMGELEASILCKRTVNGLLIQYQIRKMKAKIS
tara:strand:+ start:33474 stop:33671 length:198 start_codon:yes stop_codon:yes gene_type:complete